MTRGSLEILDWLLRSQGSVTGEDIPTLKEWKARFDAASPFWKDTIDRAAAGGFLSDRLAYAFAAGYQSALRRLLPSIPEGVFASFCITEERGGHPAAIAARIEKRDGGYAVNGDKRFITMADEAELLFAAVTSGREPDGRNRIQVVRIGKKAPGVTILPMPELKFVPEIGHCGISLRDVMIEETDILRGDGFTGYIRPFRTVEDLHIFASVTGHLFRNACLFGWDRELKETMLAMLASVRAIAADEPSAPRVHVALGGIHAQFEKFLNAVEPLWDAADGDVRARWVRDRGLFAVAGNAREKRLEKAWEYYGAR